LILHCNRVIGPAKSVCNACECDEQRQEIYLATTYRDGTSVERRIIFAEEMLTLEDIVTNLRHSENCSLIAFNIPIIWSPAISYALTDEGLILSKTSGSQITISLAGDLPKKKTQCLQTVIGVAAAGRLKIFQSNPVPIPENTSFIFRQEWSIANPHRVSSKT
jgi:hypothetical protein